MRILVLGGTAWLSREVSAEAIRRGHEVVCAARGESGPVTDGAELVTVDRDKTGALDGLADQRWDAVIDVTRIPSHSRSAVAALADSTDYWLYVSTCSVYSERPEPNGNEHSETIEPAGDDVDERSLEHYGELKRACEVAVTDGFPGRSLLLRPGLIVGPGDPSGRFAYWPHHAAAESELLVPGEPGDPVQLIDVRDLAAWIVSLAEQRRTGILDGLGPSMTRQEFVSEVLAGVGASATLTWVDHEFLVEQGVEPWMGERSLPLWVPMPEYGGFMARDVSSSMAAGLVVRALSESARDTLEWLRSTPDAPVIGLTDSEHSDLLAQAHAAGR